MDILFKVPILGLALIGYIVFMGICIGIIIWRRVKGIKPSAALPSGLESSPQLMATTCDCCKRKVTGDGYRLNLVAAVTESIRSDRPNVTVTTYRNVGVLSLWFCMECWMAKIRARRSMALKALGICLGSMGCILLLAKWDDAGGVPEPIYWALVLAALISFISIFYFLAASFWNSSDSEAKTRFHREITAMAKGRGYDAIFTESEFQMKKSMSDSLR